MKGFKKLILALVLLPMSALASTDSGLSSQLTLKKGDILRGHFSEERNLQGFKGPAKSSGHFMVAPGYGLIWSIEKPFPTDMVITPSGLAQNLGGVPVMQVSAAKIPFMLHLYDMLGGALGGDWTPLESDFIVTRTPTSSGWETKLVPRHTDNPGLPFTTILVSGDHYVKHIQMLKANGDEDNITFSNQSMASGAPSDAETTAFNSVMQ